MPRIPLPRPKKKGDVSYNARRRYIRAGERLEKQAAKETGAAAERLRYQAQQNYEKALSLYENERDQRRFAEKHDLAIPKRKIDEEKRKSRISESFKKLESNIRSPELKSDQEARELLSSKIGSRIYAATKDIWMGETGEFNQAEINQQIMDAFGAKSMSEVIKKFEDELGEDLYKEPKSLERYDEVVAVGKRLARSIKRNAKAA